MDLRHAPASYPDVRHRRPIYLSGIECQATRDLEADGCDIGLLCQPRSHLEKKVPRYRAWAADNGCFSQGESFNADKWMAWVRHLPGAGSARFGNVGAAYESRLLGSEDAALEPFGCLFVVAPDVVGDADATWRRCEPWLERVRQAGFPVAVVAQDGAEAHVALWDEQERWDALFLGGTTRWKLSSDARDCAREAHLYGKWLHMGRVL